MQTLMVHHDFFINFGVLLPHFETHPFEFHVFPCENGVFPATLMFAGPGLCETHGSAYFRRGFL
jgi:hypothetical protein